MGAKSEIMRVMIAIAVIAFASVSAVPERNEHAIVPENDFSETLSEGSDPIAVAQAAVNAAKNCNKDTGGTCHVVNCYSWRGATCQSAKCMCPGKCAEYDKGHGGKKCVDKLGPAEATLKELKEKESAVKESQAKEKVQKEQVVKESQAKEKAEKENTAKETAAKEKTAKELAVKETAAKEKAAKEAATKETAAKEKSAKKEEADKEKATKAKEKADKEAATKAAHKKCLADKKAAEEKGAAAVKAAEDCNKDTGGTCHVVNCYSWRGATCQSAKCMCPGKCAEYDKAYGGNKCVDKVGPAKAAAMKD